MPKALPTRSMSAPSDGARAIQTGEWFDGRIATGQRVAVRRTDNSIELTVDGCVAERVAMDALVRVDSRADEIRLAHRSIDGWRLLLHPPFDESVTAVWRRRGWLDSAGMRWPVVAGIAVTALVTVAFGLLIATPEVVARHMPMGWERKLGAIYDLPLEATACADPAAQSALDQLVDRLDPAARSDGLQIKLIDIDEANAAALPGQRMIVFTGLLDEVEDPDALAGIVAHEIAHVRNRDVAAGMVRDLGIGTVVTLAGGGAVAGGGGDLLSMRFTRGAEAEADRDAITMLRRARIDPARTKAAFDDFRRMEFDLPTWASTHPPSAARGEKFAAARDAGASYRPALPPAAAKALYERQCQR